MNEENTRKAEKAAEIAQTLGVAHHVVTLDWAEGERRMTESVAGYRRYPALMEQCRRVGAGVLMMAHSLDDQIGIYVWVCGIRSDPSLPPSLPPQKWWCIGCQRAVVWKGWVVWYHSATGSIIQTLA